MTFFKAVTKRVEEIASATGAVLQDASFGQIEIVAAAPVEAAVSGNITFVDNAKYLDHAATSNASAIFCQEKHAAMMPDGVAVLVHDKPYQAYGKALGLLYPTAMRPVPSFPDEGVSSRAVVGKNCNFEDDVIIEPGAVIGADVAIGRGSHIHANAVIGSGVQIGRNTSICSNCVVTNALIGDEVIVHQGVSIGSDGFGFAMGAGGHKKLPQIGRVIIQDQVEIGANSTVDRGANRDTVIGEGTKIDNLVQIGHNVVIGRHCVIVGLAGVSGSATLGDYVVVAGQAGIVGHITLGDGVQVGGGSGVHSSVAAGERVMGYPAIPANQWMRDAARQVLQARKKSKKKDDK